MNCNSARIGDVASFRKVSIKPDAGKIYHCYSLPAFDNARKPEILDGSEILSNKLLIENGDILVNKLNMRFKRIWPIDSLQANSVCSTEFVPLCPNEKVDRNYLLYILMSDDFTNALSGMRTGTSGSHQRVKPEWILDYKFPLPNIEKQRGIGDFLSALDHKIAVNTKLNGYLEELAALEFSRRFGEIESSIDLGKVLSISTKTLKPQNCQGEIWEHYSIPAYDANRRPVFELADGIKSNKYVIDANCILISKLNPSIRRIWMPACSSKQAVCSTEFIVYKPKNPVHKAFYYAAIGAPAFRDFLLAHVTGSTGSRQRTKPKATLTYPIPNPGLEAVEDFCAFANPLYEQIKVNERNSAQLEELRDTLLPKLMTGEIDVSELDLKQLNSHLA